MKKVTVSGNMDEETMDVALEIFDTFSALDDIIAYRMKSPISNLELLSIEGMIAYRAHHLRVPQWIISETFKALFNLNNLSDLRRRDFTSAVQYLVDLDIKIN